MKIVPLFIKSGVGLAVLSIGLAGCVAPYRMTTTLDPSFNACQYKTYAFLPPVDNTVTHWLGDLEHVKLLNDLLRAPLNSRGLTEVSPTTTVPDLYIYQSLKSSYNSATQTGQGVVMASDYKFANWIIELRPKQEGPYVWVIDMKAVIGDLVEQNLTNAKRGVRNAFSEYPSCKK